MPAQPLDVVADLIDLPGVNRDRMFGVWCHVPTCRFRGPIDCPRSRPVATHTG
jgi:hypothetical protein